MKIKTLLFTILLAFTGLAAQSQTLANTSWEIQNPANTVIGYFRFGADTLHYSPNNTVYSAISVYKQNGNAFSLKDVVGSCLIDTGKYTIVTGGNGFTLTLISDPCESVSSRATFLTVNHYVAIATGVQSVNSASGIQLFPNPFSDHAQMFFTNDLQDASLYLYNVTGKCVKTMESIYGRQVTINREGLAKGMYLYEIKDKQGKIGSGRLVID